LNSGRNSFRNLAELVAVRERLSTASRKYAGSGTA
jgi:hypothetical protein